MKPKHLTTIAVFCLLIVSIGLVINAVAQRPSTARQDASVGSSSYRLSGPYTHGNLTVFLVHGKDLTNKNFLTLQEALEQKKVRVYETKDVNELAIRNLSNNDIYVQAGDIVRGGDQDRMISIDFIVPPRSGRMPIAAFCVESGRWSKRGNEENAEFTSSVNMMATKDLKLAAKRERSQEAVWKNVKAAQDKLAVNVADAAPALMATSSFELSVDNAKVKETTEAYVKELSGIVQNKSDVIGYVFAINGHVNSADVYASRALFVKLWPKLLNASAVEAVAESNKDVEPKAVASETVHTFLADSEKARAEARQVTRRVKVVTREDDKNIFFETQDSAANDGWVHRNYIRKQ